MRVSAAHSPGGPFQIIGSLWAGVASAAICYAEYLGLGAVLGPALMGFGSQNKSVGTLLVVTSAVIACLVYAASKLSYLAGPRGASLSMLVMALIGLQKAFAPPAEQQVGVLACVMLGAAIMLALSANQHVQKEFKRLPAWLMPSFIYASAISIIVGATAKHLLGCLQREALQTMLIFVSATLLGIGWPYACNWLVKQLGERGYERLASNMSKLRGIALLLAGGLAWLGYEWSALSQPMGGSVRDSGVWISMCMCSLRAWGSCCIRVAWRACGMSGCGRWSVE